MKIESINRENFYRLLLEFGMPFSKKVFRFQINLFPKPDSWTGGYSSRTIDGKYVLFFDYDDLNQTDVEEELRFLQELFKLSDVYFFELPDRENSYHAVCLDKLTLIQAYSILKRSSCDFAFIHAIKYLRQREWVLRYGSKGNRKPPKFIKALKSKIAYEKREKSLSHGKFLSKMFNISIDFSVGNWDKNTKIPIIYYNTANRV